MVEEIMGDNKRSNNALKILLQVYHRNGRGMGEIDAVLRRRLSDHHQKE